MTHSQKTKTWLKTNLSFFIQLFGIIVLIVAYFYGDLVSVSDQQSLINLMITVSSIIFGIMGAWLSITKIELQEGINDAKTNTEANMYMEKARSFIKPMTISSVVLILSIVMMFLIPVISKLDLEASTVLTLKSISFTFITAFGYSIIYCLFIIIFSSADFLIGLSSQNQKLRSKRER